MNLIQFISSEVEQRGWSLSELARRAELAGPTISDVLNGKTNPGLRFYIGMARALGASVDFMLRLAGELPASVGLVDDLNEEESELIELWRACPPGAARNALLVVIRGLVKEYISMAQKKP